MKYACTHTHTHTHTHTQVLEAYDTAEPSPPEGGPEHTPLYLRFRNGCGGEEGTGHEDDGAGEKIELVNFQSSLLSAVDEACREVHRTVENDEVRDQQVMAGDVLGSSTLDDFLAARGGEDIAVGGGRLGEVVGVGKMEGNGGVLSGSSAEGPSEVAGSASSFACDSFAVVDAVAGPMISMKEGTGGGGGEGSGGVTDLDPGMH